MALWDRVMTMMALGQTMEPGLQARNIPDMDMGSLTISDMLARSQGLITRPWRVATIREALGVPAIFGAVNMIRNLTGSMSMEAFRNEIELPPADRPRLIVRPDPFSIPREFYGGTAYNLATRGEAWWWVAARDVDGLAMSLININPAEVTVEEDRNDLRYPIIRWRNRVMRNEDFRQLVYSREPGSLRGHGPLQMCGAAVSVAVEAQHWAANHYSTSGRPSMVVKSATELGVDPETGESEADTLRNQVMDRDGNTPLVIDPGIESVTELGNNDASASMHSSRAYQNSEVATMFNMDATLLNAAISGSSVTYQNVGTEFEKFLRQCLRPNYLEPIEQTMSDLLPRSTVSRFNTDSLTMADLRTRWDVYNLAIPVVGQETADAMAREFEGLSPGDVENATVPFSPPQAIPASIPQMRASEPVRCSGKRLLRGVLRPCNKLLAESAPFVGKCPRCGTEHDIQARTAAVIPIESHRKVDPLPVLTVKAVPAEKPVPEPPETPDPLIQLRDLMETMPERIAAAMPKPPGEPVVLHVHEGAIRSEVHMPPQPRVSKRIERDGTGYIVTEES